MNIYRRVLLPMSKLTPRLVCEYGGGREGAGLRSIPSRAIYYSIMSIKSADRELYEHLQMCSYINVKVDPKVSL